MRTKTIFAVGETTYDIVFQNGLPKGAVVGGSVLNTSVSLGRLGLPVSFISRMGNDQVSDLSIRFLTENGVNIDHVIRFEGNSRLSLAFLDEHKNATYQFYKAQKAPELVYPLLTSGSMVLFASTLAIREKGRNALLLFLNQAHDLGLITFYDPNIRNFTPLEMIDVRRKVEENIYLTKILKGSSEDFQSLFNTNDPDKIFEMVNCCGVEALLVTSGNRPVELRSLNVCKPYLVPAISPVSTIGAGDNFTAGLIYGFAKHKIEAGNIRNIPENIWDSIVNYAISFSLSVCQSDENYISKPFAQKLLSEETKV